MGPCLLVPLIRERCRHTTSAGLIERLGLWGIPLTFLSCDLCSLYAFSALSPRAYWRLIQTDCIAGYLVQERHRLHSGRRTYLDLLPHVTNSLLRMTKRSWQAERAGSMSEMLRSPSYSHLRPPALAVSESSSVAVITSGRTCVRLSLFFWTSPSDYGLQWTLPTSSHRRTPAS
jgi:hypothetical protein